MDGQKILKKFRKVLQQNYSDMFVGTTDWKPVEEFILKIVSSSSEYAHYRSPSEENLAKCGRCKRTLPNDYIHTYFESGNPPQDVCSVCALEMRNELHGLLPDTPFTGTLAKEFYDKTVAYYKKTNQYDGA